MDLPDKKVRILFYFFIFQSMSSDIVKDLFIIDSDNADHHFVDQNVVDDQEKHEIKSHFSIFNEHRDHYLREVLDHV